MKQTVRLSESELRHIIEESVRRVLNEEIDTGQVSSAWEISQRKRTSSPKEDEIRKKIRKLRNMIGDYNDEGKDTSELTKQINKLKKEAGFLNEGIYDYPDGIDHLIFLSENDGECNRVFWEIVKMLKKKYDKGVKLSTDILANSSVMKKYQQFVFRKFKNEQPTISKQTPRLYREYMAERMIERINSGEY